MSIGFGTDNIYYVPEGEYLSVIDLYHFHRVMLKPAEWSLFYDADRVGYCIEQIATFLSQWKEGREAEQITEAATISASFLDSLVTCPTPKQFHSGLKDVFEPQNVVYWIRCSDAPLESFFPEDYQKSPSGVKVEKAMPVIGSFRLSVLDDAEIPLHKSEEDTGFYLHASEESYYRETLDPLTLLPLNEGFFGSHGSSGKGRVINLDHDARISNENMICTPLHTNGKYFYATLYCHLKTQVNYQVIFPFPERRMDFANALFSELGYESVKQENGNEIFRRGDDIVHYYSNAAGKETLGKTNLKPFIVAVMAGKSTAPSRRAPLLQEFRKRF